MLTNKYIKFLKVLGILKLYGVLLLFLLLGNHANSSVSLSLNTLPHEDARPEGNFHDHFECNTPKVN